MILLHRYWCAKVCRRRFLFSANYFFVVPEHTPILFFYLWTFPQKIVDFVTQIAKLHYKVTRILKNPQIEYQNPQVKNLGSWKSVIHICGLFSIDIVTNICQHPPNVAKSNPRGMCVNSPLCHFCISFNQYGLFYCCQLADSAACQQSILLSTLAR